MLLRMSLSGEKNPNTGQAAKGTKIRVTATVQKNFKYQILLGGVNRRPLILAWNVYQGFPMNHAFYKIKMDVIGIYKCMCRLEIYTVYQ